MRHTDTRLVSQIHQAQFEYLRSRMEVMRGVRGDSVSTRYFEAGGVRACVAPGVPNPFFNQVFMSDPAEQRELEDALALFEQLGMTPQLEIGPGAISKELARLLAGCGFMHTRSDPILVRAAPLMTRRSGAGIHVDRVRSAEELDSFATTYVRAWQSEDWLAPMLQSYARSWFYAPGWTLYLASNEATPLGIGVLFDAGDVAYLADAATVPEYRARGVQGALIAARIADAGQSSAQLVFSRAEFGTTSQRNLERAGLESRYTVSIWTKD